jgi:ubiquitin conjugation factor E4 B
LVDQALIANTIKFYNLLAIWLVKNAAGSHDNALNELKLPFSSPPPLSFAMLPEHFVEDIAEFFQFANQFMPDFMENVPLDDMMTFITVFMSSPPYVKNPYMRAKLVDVMVGLTPKNFGKVLRFNVFERNPLAQKYLTPSLMQFYVEVEHTGASTQFYDKFNVRYSISLVMKYLWKFPMHREAFKREAQNTQSFLGFVNMLINDSIYLLDESLAKLAKIRSTQLEMSSPDWVTRYNVNERAELEQEHVRSERIVRTYLLLAHETMRMFHYLARDCASYFFNNTDLPERVASLLNYFLVQLVGPKCAELKVRNPEKYNFDPKWLLRKIVAIYLHFSTQEQFAAAVASDGRSYNHEVFMKTTMILQRERLVGEDVVTKFQHFIEQVQQQAQQESFVEDQLGDIPNEFLDPIMSTLMRDPVILPSSKVTVDRKTIARHLLSDQNDPFNRSHLTVDMLKSDVELKNKIDQFIADKMKK